MLRGRGGGEREGEGASEASNLGNLRVPVTRASSIKLLAPLWTTKAERLRLKGQFVNALMPDRDYVAEMSRLSRLRSLDEETRRLYDKEWSECKTFVDQLKAA